MIVQAENPWGVRNGLEPQRNDLWYLDMRNVVDGIMGRIPDSPIPSQVGYSKTWDTQTMYGYANELQPMGGNSGAVKFYAISLGLPELIVSPEVVRRDSRPYNVPGFDSPLGQIRVTFIMDSSRRKEGDDGIGRSEVYSLLNAWRTLVRAGRGEMSTEYALSLDKNFRASHAFDINVYFLGGVDIQEAKAAIDNPITSTLGLNVTQVYAIKNCWLSSFGIGPDLNLGGQSGTATIVANLFADDIQPVA